MLSEPDWPPIQPEEERQLWLEDDFLPALRQYLQNATVPSSSPGYKVESVDVVGDYPDATVVILFRDQRQPDCQFGYRWRNLWGAVQQPGGNALPTIIWANFDEARVLRLPEDCDQNRITWIN